MLTKRDMQFFDVANSIARAGLHPKYPMAAIIVAGTEILSVGVNVQKSHPMQMRYNKYRKMKGSNHAHHLHAEINASLKIKDKNKLKGAIIYISRIKKDGTLGMSRPCPACLNYLVQEANITDCFYTTDFGFAYEKLVA